MKIPSRKPLLSTLGLIALVVLGINLSTTLAQEGEISDLESKMSQFMDLLIQEKAQSTQNASFDPSDDLVGEQGMMAFEGPNPSTENCMGNFSSWPTSNVYQEADWEAFFIEPRAGIASNDINDFHTFTDLNGDGLVDYLYHYSYYGFATDTREVCVMLNNGAGWDSAYRCRMNKPDHADPWTFWGDCAG